MPDLQKYKTEKDVQLIPADEFPIEECLFLGGDVKALAEERDALQSEVSRMIVEDNHYQKRIDELSLEIARLKLLKNQSILQPLIDRFSGDNEQYSDLDNISVAFECVKKLRGGI